MELTSAGTAIMLAVAAGLWFLYLVPTWVRRREYLATERTATRLQQTMRVLAETAEIPDSVRIAATAREAARGERVLRAQQRRADAMVARQVRAERAATPASMPRARNLSIPGETAAALRRQRLRRTRRMVSLLMVGATLLGLTQIWLIATTGAALGSWLVLAAALALGGVAIAAQRGLDARAMPRVAAPARAARRASTLLPRELPVRRPIDPAPWTPVPVPEPLYLSKPPVQRATPAVDAGTLLRQAAAQQEEAERAARPAAPVTPLRADPPAASRASRYAGMGVLDPSDSTVTDLDEVLRRRRSAG
ncbi:MAG: hypothetical protein ABIQ01_06545 [Pseudolysinimonas sp.]